MKTRLISAAVLLPILLLVLYVLPEIVLTLAVSLMSAIGAYELLRNTGLVRNMRMVAYSMVAAILVPLWCYWGMPHAWGQLGLVAFLAALFAELMINHVKARFDKIVYCIFAGALLPMLLASVVRVMDMTLGRQLILIPFVLAFLPDSGAYFAGRYFGKHRLAPVISPNKTVEGAIGGAITAVLGMMIYAVVMDVAFDRQVNYIFALVYGVVGAAADIFGDLIFSAIKRQSGIKDYGNLIPGHGGVLDRFDSMMVVGPITESLLLLIPVAV